MRLRQLLEDRTAIQGGVRADLRRGSGRKPVVAVVAANNPEVMRCIGEVAAHGLADFRLIGDEERIRAVAADCEVPIDSAEFIHAENDAAACTLAARLATQGDADILMKGLVGTADFVRSILDRDNALLDAGQLISHVALLDIPAYHKLLLLTDAAINVEPGVGQKITMIKSAVGVARSIGIPRPKVACVAPAEIPSPRVPSTVDAEEIRRRFEAGMLRDVLGEVEIGGPFGLDVAVSREAATTKGISSPVAGDADVLLVPNLDSGNALYKSLTLFASAEVAGVVAGARVPIVLTSRADSENSKYCSVLLALAGAGASADGIETDDGRLAGENTGARRE